MPLPTLRATAFRRLFLFHSVLYQNLKIFSSALPQGHFWLYRAKAPQDTPFRRFRRIFPQGALPRLPRIANDNTAFR